MTQKKRSILAGILYLSLIIPGPFAFILIPDMIYSKIDPNTYILNHMYLIYIWILLDILIIAIEVVLAYLLYKLFESINRPLSQLAYVLRMIVVAVMVVNVGFLLTIAFGSGTNPLQFVDLHLDYTYVWQLVFSFHVLILSILLIRYIKTLWKYLGYILMIGSVGYIVDVLNYFFIENILFNTLGNVLLIFVTLAEVGMGIALLLQKATPKKLIS